MKKFLQLLHSLSSHCGLWPLVAAVLLLASARVSAIFERSEAPPILRVDLETQHPDLALIDSVLAKRAPEFGLTLRRQLGLAIAEESQKAAYDPLLILAIINVESEFDEGAVSSVGARGLMQIRPTTLQFLAAKAGLKLSRDEIMQDPALCIRLGVRYLRSLQDRFGGDLDTALMAYNAGPGRIREARRDKETDAYRFYPKRVRRGFRHFREGEGLGGDWALAKREAVAQ